MGAWLPGLATYPFSVVNNRHPLLLCVPPQNFAGYWEMERASPFKIRFFRRSGDGRAGWFGLAVARVPTLTPLARKEETSSVKRVHKRENPSWRLD